MKTSFLIVPNIDSRISTFLLYIQINKKSSLSVTSKLSEFAYAILHRLFSDKIIYISHLKIYDIKISYIFMRKLKKNAKTTCSY